MAIVPRAFFILVGNKLFWLD